MMLRQAVTLKRPTGCYIAAFSACVTWESVRMQRAGALLPSFGPTTEGGPPATMEQSLAMRPRPPEQVSATRLAGASEGAYEPYRVAPNRVAPDHDPRSRRR
eukprot:scaffold5442_cov34-Tisochrysis_lutea.AAC.5